MTHDIAAPASEPPQPISRTLVNARMPLAYMEWPNPGAPLLVLLHGSRDHSRSWDPITAVLQRTHHVVAPDLRGHGDSAWSQDGRYNYAAYLCDLNVLCDELGVSAKRPVTLVGHSLGAHIALRYAGTVPETVAQLVAIEAVGAPVALEARQTGMTLDARLRAWFDDRRRAAALQRRAFASIEEAVARMLSRHAYLTPGQAAFLTRHGLRRDEDGWHWKYDPFVNVWPFPELAIDEAMTLWARIACPTLLIYGEKSWPSTVPAQVAATIGHAQQLRLAESGHWPQHDAQDACLTAIVAFLQAAR